MIVFPNAKINLGLRILRKRTDGFHDIETIMIPIGLSDALEIVPSADGKFAFTASGIAIQCDPEENLCVKAFRMMQRKYGLPEVKIHLHKAIPAGAGLGGGSSDAAFALKLTRRLFSIKVCGSELLEMAAALGSDCPFFIENKTSVAAGRGEALQPFPLSLKGYHLLLVKPDINVSTPWAYNNITPSGIPLPAPDQLRETEAWDAMLVNDFEPAVMKTYPEIKEVRDRIRDLGAFYTAMSGSGSAVFGLFKSAPLVSKEDFSGMFVWQELC